jgi:hypothetical protein
MKTINKKTSLQSCKIFSDVSKDHPPLDWKPWPRRLQSPPTLLMPRSFTLTKTNGTPKSQKLNVKSSSLEI